MLALKQPALILILCNLKSLLGQSQEAGMKLNTSSSIISYFQ